MRFCLSKLNWFSDAVPLYHLNGFFAEVYAAIDTDQFSGCFSRWVADSVNITKGEIIAIDGKCLRRSIDKASKKAAIYMVSAWAQQNNLVLAHI